MLPSIRLAHFLLFSSTSDLILSLSSSRSTPSPVVDRSPRGEKRDRGSSSGFLSFPLSLLHRYFAFLLRPLPSALRTAGHLDGRLSIHQGPTSPLPIDRLCPRRENSRGVDLPSPDTCLAGVPFRRSRGLTVSPIPQFFFYRSRAPYDFLQGAGIREINHSTICIGACDHASFPLS